MLWGVHKSQVYLGLNLGRIPMSWPHRFYGSCLPSHNDGQSTILKGMSGSWEGSSEECVPLFPFPFYRQRGTAAVYDRFGNEIFSQIPSGDTPITVDSEEIKVVHFEIWLLLAHWLSNRLVGWNTHGKENDQKNSVTICHRYVSQPSIYMIKCWGSFIRPPTGPWDVILSI